MNQFQLLFKWAMLLSFTLLFLTVSFSIVRAAGEVDPAFNPALVQVRNISSIDQTSVNRITVQADGKILVAGYFQAASKFARSGIVRLNADGTIDATFNPPVIYSTYGGPGLFGGNIFAVAVQSDGKILIGGDFDTVGGQARPRIARLNADGSFDSSFNILRNGATFTGEILDLKVSTDGKITFGGGFSYNAGGIRYGIARVLADGSPDTSFNSPAILTAAANIWKIEILSGDKTLISGAGTNTNSNAGFIYRLNADGSQDTVFSAITTAGSNSGSSAVTALRVQPDGKILGGGSFTTVNGFPVRGLARFNADGSIDTSFNLSSAGSNGFIFDIEITSSGRILVGGRFSTYNGTSRTNVALLDAGGSLDNSLVYAGSQQQLSDLLILPDGKILLGGSVNQDTLLPALIKLNADGSVDSTFNLVLGNSGKSNKVLAQPDGKILIGGVFTYTDSQIRYNLSRVNADGTLDATFSPTFSNAEIFGLDIRADSKILVSSGNNIYRLNTNGSLDRNIYPGGGLDAKFLPGGGAIVSSNFHLRKTFEAGGFDSSFDVTADNNIRRILLQPDGKFIVVGDFTTIAGVARGRIARINANGTLDTSFNPNGGASNSIFDAVLQPDGKVIIGGNFPGVNFNNNYKYLARLNTDGSLDTSFNPLVEGGVQSLRIQPNGKILVGGSMYSVNGLASRVVRLNQDGSLDSSFNSSIGPDDAVLSIDVQTGGGIIIGGLFTHVNNLDRLGIARLIDTAQGRTPFDFDGDGRADVSVFRPSNGVWYLNQSTNGFTGAAFGQAGDKIVPADYDGDGKTDLAVVRNGVWYIQRSSLGFTGVQFGNPDDVPVPADYDGDGRADVAVFRPSNGTWYLQQSTNGFVGIQLGVGTDKPVPADYNGDGRAEVAVYRPSNGTWYLSTNPATGFGGVVFGASTDVLVPADYDGDGKTDLAVFRPSNGTWYIQRSTAGFVGVAFGLGTDLPVPADYDGDGKADIAVVRNGIWYLNRSTQGFTGIQFGYGDDKPLPNVFVR